MSQLIRIQNSKVTALKPVSNYQMHTSYRDPDGATWLGTRTGLIRYPTNKVDRIDVPGPAGKSTDVYPYSITRDSAGRLLALFTVMGLRRLENGQWKDLATLGLPANCRYTLSSDSAGRIWEGCSYNRVVLLEGDKVRVFSSNDGLNVGDVETIRTRKDSVWVAGTRGLQHFDGHRFVTVAPTDGSVFRGVSGLVVTANNGIWFSEARGLIHIEEDETRRLEKNPGYRVKYQALDVLDGLSDGLQSRYPERNMIEGTDGRLWFATARGVIGLDPKRIPTRPLPPQAAILSLIANEQKHLLPASAEMSLPARTTNLQFVYTAGSLAIPERVRFRYKLDGQDKDWQDAGTRREAFYTNLGPGSYRFHVMASNGDGLWKEAGTTAGFLIQPAFFQTGWFFSLCVAAGGVFLWMLYILRIRHVTAQVQARLGERMVERERIARELHDTLLQGFSGLVLKFQAAMKQLPQDLPARQLMESALDRADEVLLEGRTRVRDLRAESIERQDLAAAFEDCGEELQYEGAPSLGLVITGTPRPLDPIVYDEVYRIGREALVNAFQHSKASTIEVEITYEPAGFRLRVRDDGRGFSQDIVDHGKPGHWGLAGIRERAQNIGGKLTIWSHAAAGTELELTIPARLVYKLIPQESRWRKWWKHSWKR